MQNEAVLDVRLSAILERIVQACREIFEENLVGVYLHGSAALGCFNWAKSDIDFLVVTGHDPAQAEKERFIRFLLALDRQCPEKGLEMSVVREADCRPFAYPTPFSLHFSNAHRERARADLAEYCAGMHGVDPDLAAHCTILRAAGVTVWGKPIGEVFGEVPAEAYWDSIWQDVRNAREDVADNPVYCILNLCRVLAYGREGKALSKRQGGEWALGMLPEEEAEIVRTALWVYAGAYCGAFPVEEKRLRCFAGNMLEKIRAAGEKFFAKKY